MSFVGLPVITVTLAVKQLSWYVVYFHHGNGGHLERKNVLHWNLSSLEGLRSGKMTWLERFPHFRGGNVLLQWGSLYLIPSSSKLVLDIEVFCITSWVYGESTKRGSTVWQWKCASQDGRCCRGMISCAHEPFTAFLKLFFGPLFLSGFVWCYGWNKPFPASLLCQCVAGC